MVRLKAIVTRISAAPPFKYVTRSRLLKAFYAGLTVALGTVATNVFKNWWDSPRPSLEILQAEVIEAQRDENVQVHDQLRLPLMASPFFKPNPLYGGTTISHSSLEELVRSAALERERAEPLKARCDELTGLLQSLPQGFDRGKARQNFLELWHQDAGGELLDRFAFNALTSGAVPPSTRPFPRDAPAAVRLPKGGVITLLPADPRELPDPLQLELALFVPQQLLAVLAESRRDLEEKCTTFDKLKAQLEQLARSGVIHKLRISALVANTGGRPFGIRELGAAHLWDQAHGLLTILDVRGDVRRALFVESGKGIIVSLVSSDALEDVISREPDSLGGDPWSKTHRYEDSRLAKGLAAGEGWYTDLTIAKAGVPPADAAIGPSARIALGTAGLEQLQRSVRREQR